MVEEEPGRHRIEGSNEISHRPVKSALLEKSFSTI